MAREGRNLLTTIFKNFVNSLKPRSFRGTLVGSDHFGNKYFEGSENQRNSKKPRWFEPKGGEANFDQELPAEWESWLRGRRKYPPTKEEIDKNIQKLLSVKKNAEDIEKQYTKKGDKFPVNKNFPKYEEYEEMPGKDPKKL